ncbi:hypothetical protein [Azospirillum sp. SYSU D00513]|uniref:HAD family hydrolase n=1 Tax=Azospirillum sp. SYSU D00513 TaxID=2812561 RepID=UPI001A96F425|nr:hypothetical protein [Azospirillum sp. SYSU D00513]
MPTSPRESPGRSFRKIDLENWAAALIEGQATGSVVNAPKAGSALADPRTGAAELLSFDVFDTLITRLWFKPADLFLVVGRDVERTGLYPGDAEAWADARRAAERDAREISPCEEVSLDTIYGVLGQRLDWTPEQSRRAQELECRRELRAVRPIAEMLFRLRRAPGSPLLISDTYFDETFVERLLDQCGLDRTGIRLFTSSRCGLTKRTGRLFDHVLRSTGVPADRLAHTGDHPRSDYKNPKQTGIRAQLYRNQEPTRYEEGYYAAKGNPKAPRLLRSAVAGCARAARLGGSFEEGRLQSIWNTSANVAGPLLTGFVLWTLLEAKNRKLGRLYFLARDGQILCEIAKVLTGWLGWSIDCRYLHASRQAYFLPSVTSLDTATAGWFSERPAGKTLAQILARAKIGPLEVASALARAGWERDAWDRPLAVPDSVRLRQLLEDTDVRTLLLERASDERELVLAYLRQEGVGDGTPFGIVDVGWRGRLQRCLQDIMATADDLREVGVHGFYFGLTERPAFPPQHTVTTYTHRALPFNAALVETFTAADHGGVKGFQRMEKGTTGPLLREERNTAALEWGLEIQQKSIMAFARNLTEALDAGDVPAQEMVEFLRTEGCRALDLLTYRPDPGEAEAYGSFQHSEDLTHAMSADIATKMVPAALFGLVWAPGITINERTIWLSGSIVRSCRPTLLRRTLLEAWNMRRHAAGLLRAWQARRRHGPASNADHDPALLTGVTLATDPRREV